MYKLVYTIDSMKNEKMISWERLHENRKEIFLIQENAEENIVLFCECNKTAIPMLLTKHDTPHIKTKNANDKGLHYKFCKHLITNSNGIVYNPAIEIDDNGDEIAKVCFSKLDSEV